MPNQSNTPAAIEKNFFYKPFFMPPKGDVFSERAVRFDELADQQPDSRWSDYLRLLAHLARAQHNTLAAQHPVLPELRSHPLLPASDGSNIPESFHTILHQLIGELIPHLPDSSLQSRFEALLALSRPEAEALAARILQNEPLETDRPLHIWVQAALQIVWTAWAVQLTEDHIPPTIERSICPCCGGEGVASIVYASGEWNNLRYLHCATCNSRWNTLRAKCTFCGEQSGMSLQAIQNAPDGVLKGARAESCEACGHYRKMFMLQYQQYADPIADDLATLPLDILMGEGGYLRGGHNPFLLAG